MCIYFAGIGNFHSLAHIFPGIALADACWEAILIVAMLYPVSKE